MKRKYICFLTILISVMIIPLTFALATDLNRSSASIVLDLTEKKDTEKNRLESIINKTPIPEFILPVSLEVIEEEAFEGTRIIWVEVPDTVSEIGDRAFANIKTLRVIKISARTNYISDSALAGSNGVTISAPSGSYARTWARSNGIPFSPVASFAANAEGATYTGAATAKQEMIVVDSVGTPKTERQQRRQEEIQTESFIDLLFYSIQGRGPPMA